MRSASASRCSRSASLVDAGEFGFRFNPRRLLLNERHRLFQPAVIFGCGSHVYRRTDQCNWVPVLLDPETSSSSAQSAPSLSGNGL